MSILESSLESRPGEGLSRRFPSEETAVVQRRGTRRGVEGSSERECLRVDPGPGRQCTDFKEITWFAQCFTARNSKLGLLIVDSREDLVVLDPHVAPEPWLRGIGGRN